MRRDIVRLSEMKTREEEEEGEAGGTGGGALRWVGMALLHC